MTKTKAFLIVAYLLAFAAGTSLGLFVLKPGPAAAGSWLERELNLTSDQRDQMRKIWAESMGGLSKAHGERRSANAQERDQAVLALLTEAQRAKYDAIQQDYARKMDELSQERKKAFEEAVAKTKGILTAAQAQKYDELMKKQRERPAGAGWGSHGPWRRHTTSSSSRPATETQPAPRGGE